MGYDPPTSAEIEEAAAFRYELDPSKPLEWHRVRAKENLEFLTSALNGAEDALMKKAKEE